MNWLKIFDFTKLCRKFTLREKAPFVQDFCARLLFWGHPTNILACAADEEEERMAEVAGK